MDKLPTWSLSFNNHNLHDPEHGILVPVFRNFPPSRKVMRSLDFEWDSPFKGVSLYVPDRVALHDIWVEVANALDTHQILEPYDLLKERASSLSKQLPKQLLSIQDPDLFIKAVNNIENSFPKESKKRILFQNNSREYLGYITILGISSFEEFLPSPDLLSTNPKKSLQASYSDQRLASYLHALFSKFLQMYFAIIDLNFKQVSQYLNLYRQLPSSFVFFINSSRTHVRVFAFPEESESETELRVYFLQPGVGDDISSGVLRVDNNKPSDEAVRDVLIKSGKKTNLVFPIDILLPMEEIFKENPISNLTINWIKSELAQLLNSSFKWPNI